MRIDPHTQGGARLPLGMQFTAALRAGAGEKVGRRSATGIAILRRVRRAQIRFMPPLQALCRGRQERCSASG